MIHFDLPAVKVDLQQGASLAVEFGAQQVSGLAIVPAPGLAFAVGSGGDDEQAQGTGAGAMLPEHLRKLFIADSAPPAAIEDLGGLPGDVVIEADLFGSKLVGAINAAAFVNGGETQSGVFAGAGNDF